MKEVPVLIAGGGPVGLTASLMLSRLGIRSLLVERHPGTAIHPKARGINARTMEIFHQQGIEDDVRTAGLPPDKVGFEQDIDAVIDVLLALHGDAQRRPHATLRAVGGDHVLRRDL